MPRKYPSIKSRDSLKTGKLWEVASFSPLSAIMDNVQTIPAGETVAFAIKYLRFKIGQDWLLHLPPSHYCLTVFYKGDNAYRPENRQKLSLQATVEFTVRD